MLRLGEATAKTIEGCSKKEIDKIEKQMGHALPVGYRDFLGTFGKRAGHYMEDMSAFYPEILELNERARGLLSYEDDEGRLVVTAELPDKAFVFAERYGEQFWFFHLDDGNDQNPMCYHWADWHERRGKFGTFRRSGSFWKFMHADVEGGFDRSGEYVVFAGYPQYEDLAIAQGAKVQKSVNGKTTLLVVGSDPSPAKVAKAKAMGVKIMKLGEFLHGKW